jgi:hypothetical protein
LDIAIYFFLAQNRQMDTTETGRLCKAIEHAAAQIHTQIGNRTDIAEVLERLWFLQDSLNRLLEVVVRERGDVSQCRSLIRKVVYALESPQARKRAKIPGVRNSCEQINNLLIRLEQATQQDRTASVWKLSAGAAPKN